jgi:hypothetical protein
MSPQLVMTQAQCVVARVHSEPPTLTSQVIAHIHPDKLKLRMWGLDISHSRGHLAAKLHVHSSKPPLLTKRVSVATRQRRLVLKWPLQVLSLPA